MADKLVVNPIDCEARGACAELLPEMITLDEWGYPIIDPRPVPPLLEKHARSAVSACPTLALRLLRSSLQVIPNGPVVPSPGPVLERGGSPPGSSGCCEPVVPDGIRLGRVLWSAHPGRIALSS